MMQMFIAITKHSRTYYTSRLWI